MTVLQKWGSFRLSLVLNQGSSIRFFPSVHLLMFDSASQHRQSRSAGFPNSCLWLSTLGWPVMRPIEVLTSHLLIATVLLTTCGTILRPKRPWFVNSFLPLSTLLYYFSLATFESIPQSVCLIFVQLFRGLEMSAPLLDTQGYLLSRCPWFRFVR